MKRSVVHAIATGLLLFGLAVGCQFVAVTYGAGGEKPPKVVVADAPQQDQARLRMIDGVPVARLSGTPFEMGRQHGALFKKQIRFLYREYFEALAVPAVGRKELRRWAGKVEPFIPKHLREELRGLAEGAGMSYDETLMINAMVDRLQSMMCSTVVANHQATKDGEVYFGRNLDFPGRNFLHRATIVLTYEPKGGTRLVSVTWPGLIGVLSGMNEHGVAGATMMIHKGKEIRPGLPYMLMYREALSGARKMGDVFESFRKAARTCPNNFMVVDSTGAAEVIEWDQEVVARRSTEDGCICSTNHFRTSKLAGTGWNVGTARYKTLSRFLEDEHGAIDLAGIKRALKDVATPWFLNVQAMIFLPARRSMHVAVGDKLPAAAQSWVHLSRDVLFPEVMRALSALLIAASFCRADIDLAALRKAWPKFDRDQKLQTLMRVSIERSPKLLVQCDSWLAGEEDVVVRGQLVRIVARHVTDPETRKRAETAVRAYVKRHLKARRQREAKEFNALHRKLKRKVPPDNVMKAGADWTDPYDVNRKLPRDILAERLHMREVIAAIEGTGSRVLRQSLVAIFREHHDPVVLVRVIEVFESWRDWRALPDMADLVRIQQHGRMQGGGAVIGHKVYDALKLKWDAYKDQLWWSRPEYVPRAIRPICKTASKITGINLRSATEIDAWMLAHGAKLTEHGVVLSRAFVTRAKTSQR